MASIKAEATPPLSFIKRLTIIDVVTFALLLGYGFAFFHAISPYLFNPNAVNDDAFQQLYPFYKALTPQVFDGDLITTAMQGYLLPLHWYLGSFITSLTRDPIMTGHWMTLIQLTVSLIFLWVAVRKASSFAVANISVVWLLQAQTLTERMASGLPRGWLIPIITAFFVARAYRNDVAVLVLVIISALLNPPGTAVICGAYAMELAWCGRKEWKTPEFRRRCMRFIGVGLLIVVLTATLLPKSSVLGRMVTLSEAKQMAEFQRGSGRFKLLPFRSPLESINSAGMRAFIYRETGLPPFLGHNLGYLLVPLFIALLIIAKRRGRTLWPAGWGELFVASTILYFLARWFAFRLYVPDRYILSPWGIWFIAALPVALWRVTTSSPIDLRSNWTNARGSAIALCALLGFLFYCNGWGLEAPFGFTMRRPEPDFYHAVATLTPESSLIGGNPEAFGGLPLFAGRRFFASSEVAHPFYMGYYGEMKRRLKSEWRAVYAPSPETFLKEVQSEKIDYFLFRAGDYSPKKLVHPETFMPMGQYLVELIKAAQNRFLYHQILNDPDATYLLYRDKRVILIDCAKFALNYASSPYWKPEKSSSR